ncbi:hypothetical protein EON82_20235 [bacterium]|nr:MAG: hypothetical protein EON82_20235 [bacterium]
MRRRWIAPSALTSAAAAIAFAGWFPYYRLEREVAAARAEGLWTELSDIPKAIEATLPKGENAAPLIREAIAKGKESGMHKAEVGEVARRILKGTSTSLDRARFLEIVTKNQSVLETWRRAARCPRLDYKRDWSQGYAVLFPEFADIKRASQILSATAAVGTQPKGNLLAAARLSVLTRQEPSVIAQLVSVAIGRIALKEAKREGLATEVEKALGPPPDVRWTYAAEFPCALDTMRRVGDPEWFKYMGASDQRSFAERIRNTGPWKANAAYRLVHEYRQLWSEMPKEPKDYDTAIRAIDRWVPKINAELWDASSIMSKLMGGSSDVSDFVKSFKKFEAERQATR